MHSPLPSAWVDKLFEKILVRYGTAWTRQWEGIDMAAVKADWAEELAGFVNHPKLLAYGLDHLPADRPPTVQQFAAACNRMPPEEFKALPAPQADRQRVAEVIAKIAKPEPKPAKTWAESLRKREVALERLTKFQRGAWREVLRPGEVGL